MTDTIAAFISWRDRVNLSPDHDAIALAAWKAAINHERSECAKVCEMVPSQFGEVSRCAAAIRARSQP
jgi:hypothetical protein